MTDDLNPKRSSSSALPLAVVLTATAALMVLVVSSCGDSGPDVTPTAARGRVTVDPLPPASETPRTPPTLPPLPDTPAPPAAAYPGGSGASGGDEVGAGGAGGADGAGGAAGAAEAGGAAGAGSAAGDVGSGGEAGAAGVVPAVLAGACRVVRETEQVTLMPIWDAPTAVHEAWAVHAIPSLLAEVTEHNTEHRFHRLRAIEAPEGVPVEHDFVVAYEGEPVPLEIGSTYRFTAQRDLAGTTPVGRALRVDDEGGMVFLFVAARETDRAHDRVLGGDRGGVTVRQVASPCTEVIVDECGYELRSAPAEFGLGGASLSLMRGVTGTLQSEPQYDVELMTSHLRRWVGDLPCPDPTDWVLSYRLERR